MITRKRPCPACGLTVVEVWAYGWHAEPHDCKSGGVGEGSDA